MAVDKVLLRIEAKLNALLEESGLDPAQFGEKAGKQAARAPRTLTAAEQEAIDNAPKHIEARPRFDGPNGRASDDNAPANVASPAPAIPVEDDTSTNAQSAAADSAAPWEGYDDNSAEDVVRRLRSMDAAARDKALAYERENKNRVTITRVQWTS